MHLSPEERYEVILEEEFKEYDGNLYFVSFVINGAVELIFTDSTICSTPREHLVRTAGMIV